MGPAPETLYQTLGVPAAASHEEIRAAYRRVVLEYHPDRHRDNPLAGLAAARLAAANAAYEVLSDPRRRAAYDAELAAAGRGGVRAAPQVRREVRALAVLLRAIQLVLVLVFLSRLVPLLWRVVRRAVVAGAETLAGTPAVPAAFVAVAALVVALAWRRRRRRGRSPAA